MIGIVSALKDFMRRECLCFLREISALRSVDDKLLIVEFHVRVFALIGDVEVCGFYYTIPKYHTAYPRAYFIFIYVVYRFVYLNL